MATMIVIYEKTEMVQVRRDELCDVIAVREGDEFRVVKARVVKARRGGDGLMSAAELGELIARHAAPDVPQRVRCVVAGFNSYSRPDLLAVVVLCTLTELENGVHYNAARRYAAGEGFSGPVVFDQEDGVPGLFSGVAWDSVAEVKCVPADNM